MNTTPHTPPPAPSPSPETPRPPSRTAAVAAITTVTAIIGGAVLLFTGATAAYGAVRQITSTSSTDVTATADTTGVTGIDVEAGGADVVLRFGDVDEAVMEVSGQSNGWTMKRDDDEILVRDPRVGFGWWVAGWFGDQTTVTITLPEALNGRIDADLSLSAGSMRADGDFRDLDIGVSAGGLTATGSAQSVTAELSAGDAELRLANVREVDLNASAGRIVAEFTGSAPDEVDLELSAGSMDVTLPDVEYAVTQDLSAGSLESELRTSSTSRHVVSVSASAGSIELFRGR